MDVAGLAEADFVLGRMHVDVDRGRIDAEVEHERRMACAREGVAEPDPDACRTTSLRTLRPFTKRN